MKKAFCICLVFLFCFPLLAYSESLPVYPYTWQGTSICTEYSSETLHYTIERGRIGEEAYCYFTKIWMEDPGKQISKAMGEWETALLEPGNLALTLPESARLAVNGSGFVSPSFPEIPENYPGTSEDYYYTALGSLTITDGKVYRNLQGVPFYGLTLQEDGLHLHVGEAIEDILARNPTQTWSFYEGCPLIQNGKSLLDEEWTFAKRKAIRNIIAKMDDNNYVIITATSTKGLTLVDAVAFLQEQFHPEWAYNLDGGSSAALLTRKNANKPWEVVYGNRVKVTDIMGFGE